MYLHLNVLFLWMRVTGGCTINQRNSVMTWIHSSEAACTVIYILTVSDLDL